MIDAKAPWAELAPAKVNLCLHVGPVQANAYHPLASLVAFADVGDWLTAEPAETLSLTVTGPFAEGLSGEGDNLILRALRGLAEITGTEAPRLALGLDKRLPIASGLGGGSSDAGAALRLAKRLTHPEVEDAALVAAARLVGADGPMCLRARTAWAEGVGEQLSDRPGLPPLHALLVNPGVACSTGAVYRAYDAAAIGSADRPSDPEDLTPAGVIAWLGRQRNDLEAPALGVAPAIAQVVEALRRCEGVGLVRMSGSGATVFALFEQENAAARAFQALRESYPAWWTMRTVLGDRG